MDLSADTNQARGLDSRERDRLRQAFPGPYAEGQTAHANGLDLSANPYRQGTDEHNAWYVGYTDAENAFNA